MSRVSIAVTLLGLFAIFFLLAAIGARASDYRYTSCDVDSDNDRIMDCYETNTGIYVSPTDTGTNPADHDTDGDGLWDGDEVYGTTAGLNLPFYGVSPVHQDILLEYDWMEDATGCAAHSHKPTEGAVDLVRQFFEKAPVDNPDGVQGIHVFQDVHYGPASNVNYSSHLIPDADGIIQGNIHSPPHGDWDTYEATYFPAKRKGSFHYVIFAHAYSDHPQSSGSATIPGYQMIVSMGCYWYAPDWKVASAIVHELGHNVALRHGGNTECNYKPNYNSIMNYRFQFTGVANCSLAALDGSISFSRGTRRDLDESSLYEPDGVCTTGTPVPIDWNFNGMIDTTPYARVLTPPDVGCPSGYPVLHDFDDYAHLFLAGIHSTSVEVAVCAPATL